MRTEVMVVVQEGHSFFDDQDDLSIRVNTGISRENACFRRLRTHGLVHLTTRRFQNQYETEMVSTVCGMFPKRFDSYGPKLSLDEEDGILWRDICKGCAGTLFLEFQSRKDHKSQERIEEMKMEQPEIVVASPPPKTGPRTDPETRDLMKSLIATAFSNEGEWVSIENRAASVSTVYREFARGRIEVVHRKGRLYVRSVIGESDE